MSATITETAAEPLRALIDDWADREKEQANASDVLLTTLEETACELQAWSDRLAEQQADDLAEQERIAAEQQAFAEHRRKLEHDLKLARTRVADLEQTLQQRTEELLHAQAANNALAAELQAAELNSADSELEAPDEAAPAPPSDGAPEAIAEGADPDADSAPPGESVSERFARLRKSR